MKQRTDHRIHTENDIETLWRDLMDPLGFTERAINLVLINGTEVLPDLITIGDLTEDSAELDHPGFVETFRTIQRELNIDRISALVSRPGQGGPTPADKAWVRLVQATITKAHLPPGMTYLATDTDLRPIQADDLM